MKKKAQIDGVGSFLVLFIAVIVGLVLFTSISTLVGEKTVTVETVNQSVTLAAANVTNILNGQAVVGGTITMVNATGNETVAAAQYSVGSNQVVNGVLESTVTMIEADYASTPVLITYTYEPDGYMSGSSRSIALLIPIFAALAILVAALSPTMRSGVMNMVGK